MVFRLLDRVRVSVTGTPGTGTITTGSPLPGFRSFAAAGANNLDEIPYLIEDGNNWEVGAGTWISGDDELVRSVITASTTSGPAAITASSAAIVSGIARATDIHTTIEQMRDVSVIGLEVGQVLEWGGDDWINVSPNGDVPSFGPGNLFTQINNGTGVATTATYSSSSGLSIVRTDAGVGDSASFYGEPVSLSAAWSHQACIEVFEIGTTYARGGIALYNSSSGKFILFGFSTQSPNLTCFYMSNLNTYSTTIQNINIPISAGIAPPKYFKITYDGSSTYTCYYSWDNLTWYVLTTIPVSSYFAADFCGVGLEAYQTVSVFNINVTDWQ